MKVRERKKTAVHGTLVMTLRAWKFNFKQICLLTLNSRINTLKVTAHLKFNIDRKYSRSDFY